VTIVVDRQLWFDSCLADTGIWLAFFWLFAGGIFFVGWIWQRRGEARAKTLMAQSVVGTVLITIIVLVQPFPPEIVRISIADTGLEVRRCHRWTDEMQTYPVADVEFRYEQEERGSKKIVHHLLTMHRRGRPERLGSVEFVPRYSFDFEALRQLAPAALRQYEIARQPLR
jgi:hypothetical protein